MLETVVTYPFENSLWVVAVFVTGYLSCKAGIYHAKIENTRKKVEHLPCDKRKE